MKNPISEKTRSILYILGISVGILAVVAGPLMIALETPEAWVAVVVSAIGAVTTLLSTLARANLDGTPAGPVSPAAADVVVVDIDDDPVGRLTD